MRSEMLWRSGICGLVLLGWVATGAAAEGKGVVVEDLGLGSSAFRAAGVQVGDLVLAWERLPAPPANPEVARGEIESYFDWWWLVHEQAPRGTVLLTVERSGERREIEVAPGLWTVAKVRAWLPEDLLAQYQEGQGLVESGEVEQGVAAWLDLAEVTSPWEVHSWLLLQIGEAWSEAREWATAQNIFSAALQVANNALSRGSIQYVRANAYRRANQVDAAQELLMAVRESWEKTFGNGLLFAQVVHNLGNVALDRRDLALAENRCKRSLEIRLAAAPGSLDLASSFNNLGVVAFLRGDLSLAEDYYQRCLEIRQQLAPNSLDLASSLNNLGLVVMARGDLPLAEDYYQRSLEIQQQLAPNSLDLASSLSALGSVVLARGDLPLAEGYYQRSLELRQQLAPGSLGVASSLGALGSVALGRGDLPLAESYYQRSLELRQQLAPNSLDFAGSLSALGLVASGRGDLPLAEGYYQRSLELRQQLAPGSLGVASSLGDLGLVALGRGDLPLAESYYQRSLEIRQQLAPNSLDLASSLNNLGLVVLARGDLPLAEDYYQRSLEIQQQLAPNSFDLASSLSALGSVVLARGDLPLAEGYFQRSLELRQRLAPGSLDVASSLSNLGHVALYRSNIGLAEGYYQRSLEIVQEVSPNRLALANSLLNLGNVTLYRGNLDQAEDYFQRSLELRQQLPPNSLDLAGIFNNLGVVVRKRGDLGLAEVYLQRSLKIQQQLVPNSLDLAYTLNNLGAVAKERGDLDQAAGYFQGALEIRQRLVPSSLNFAYSLFDLGEVARDRGDLILAERHYRSSLEIRQRLAPGSAEEAATLHALATLNRRQSKPYRALLLLDQALNALEIQLKRLGGSRERQANFRAEAAKYYRDILEVSLELQQPENAFHALERFRARTFLQQLTERDTVFTADIPEDLDHRRRTLAVRVDRTQGQLADLNPRDHAEQIDEIHEQLRQLRQESERLEQDIVAASPRLAALQYPQPLDFEAARATLDAGTLLLAFSLGEETSSVFAVSPGEELHVETLPIGEEDLRRKIEGFRSSLETTLPNSPRMAGLEARARGLYDTLLAPLSERIENAERLLILPEGPLYYLPWAALRRPVNDGAQYLVEHKSVHISVSATVYSELQQDRRPAPAQGIRVAGFGDPVYPGSQNAARGHDDIIVRSISERSIFDWQRLPQTRREIEGLAALYPESSFTYLGPQATEEQAKALGRDVHIIHFATHGHIDDRFPVNSFLALSIPEELEEGQDNGLLQVWEIYESLRLDADLVVLSACESGLGEELRGEGLMGLTRAFHYAGARSVLSTLWSVDDDSTAELMLRFHRHLASGLSKDEALRAAQLELIRRPIVAEHADNEESETQDASAPRSWAAFQLYGDWQ